MVSPLYTPNSNIIVAKFLPLGPNHAPPTFVMQLITNGIPILMKMTPKVGISKYTSHNPSVVKALIKENALLIP
jgi:hypothetical protein